MLTSRSLIILLGIVQWISAADEGGDATFCKSFEDCRNDGYRVWNALQTTLMDPLPMDKTDGFYIFPTAYVVQPSDVQFGYAGLEEDLGKHGFDVKGLSDWETASINPQTHEPDDPAAYDNSFDTKNGLIVAHWNHNQADNQRQLKWSEIAFQTWQFVQKETKGGSISNLRAVIRHEVANGGTLNTLRTLFRNRLLQPNAKDENWYAWTEAEQDFYFFALLGTANVKGVLWLLRDHAVAIGMKEITRVWVRWPNIYPDVSGFLKAMTDPRLEKLMPDVSYRSGSKLSQRLRNLHCHRARGLLRV
ncbi:MAG: hypothetical protein Q9216_005848 [Gyalolechia sp. 2 TL-2023]